jgi:alpha-glucosidase (family GH31 glycosyl hydrolase)
MPANSVDELNISNFLNTGQTTAVARYTFTMEIKWTDDEIGQRTHGPQTYTYPNDIAAMPLAVRKRYALEMIKATARVALGIDTWEMYE